MPCRPFARPAAAAVLLVAGVLLGGCGSVGSVVRGDCAHRGKDGSLGADASHGRSLFVQQCAACHTLADAGAAGAAGPSLDELRPDADDVCQAVTRGIGVMPADLLRGQDVTDVAAYVEQATGGAAAPTGG